MTIRARSLSTEATASVSSPFTREPSTVRELLKPSIPLVGENAVELHDEVELEFSLAPAATH